MEVAAKAGLTVYIYIYIYIYIMDGWIINALIN